MTETKPPIRMTPPPIRDLNRMTPEEIMLRRMMGQMNALIDYQKACAKASMKYLDDLEKIEQFFRKSKPIKVQRVRSIKSK